MNNSHLIKRKNIFNDFNHFLKIFLCALHGVKSANLPTYIAEGVDMRIVTSLKAQPDHVQNLEIIENFECEEEMQH